MKIIGAKPISLGTNIATIIPAEAASVEAGIVRIIPVWWTINRNKRNTYMIKTS